MPKQLSLWADAPESLSKSPFTNAQSLSLPDADIWFDPAFLDSETSDRLFEQLKRTTQWKQEQITICGKTMPLPRLTAWYGDPGTEHCYSGITMIPQGWTPALLEIRAAVEAIAPVRFNSVLLNLYRQGQDSVAWHSDDEPELGQNPTIASVSLGATRRFKLRHKHQKTLKQSLDLTHGSLLLMQGSTQHYWQHQVPKTAKPVGDRINLTFRVIYSLNG
ncbi:MAG: alpha-ketoglutarate-dependent dioxygenase AlkB [Elainellaceae cyanobacterium]